MSEITELRVGDYIEGAEIDTEQKYNNVVEVFKQYGISEHHNHLGYRDHHRENRDIGISNAGYCYTILGNTRKLTYDQIMSLKKVDWESAPRGAEFYADGMFWFEYQCMHDLKEGYCYHKHGDTWTLDRARSKQTLMGFPDYEERPTINTIEGDDEAIELQGKARMQAQSVDVDNLNVDKLVSESETNRTPLWLEKVMFNGKPLSAAESESHTTYQPKKVGPFKAPENVEMMKFDVKISEDVTDEDRENMFITAVQYMQEEGLKFDGKGWYRKEYVKEVK